MQHDLLALLKNDVFDHGTVGHVYLLKEIWFAVKNEFIYVFEWKKDVMKKLWVKF